MAFICTSYRCGQQGRLNLLHRPKINTVAAELVDYRQVQQTDGLNKKNVLCDLLQLKEHKSFGYSRHQVLS